MGCPPHAYVLQRRILYAKNLVVETRLPPAFLERYPKVRLQVIAVDRAVDLIEERIDVALRVRLALVTDAALTMRTLGHSSRILVAAPHLIHARFEPLFGRIRTRPL